MHQESACAATVELGRAFVIHLPHPAIAVRRVCETVIDVGEIAFHIAPGAHAVIPLDQAGWHASEALEVPANISLMPLPSECPELNPVENVWQFMRDIRLSNRIFKSNYNVLDHCC